MNSNCTFDILNILEKSMINKSTLNKFTKDKFTAMNLPAMNLWCKLTGNLFEVTPPFTLILLRVT